MRIYLFIALLREQPSDRWEAHVTIIDDLKSLTLWSRMWPPRRIHYIVLGTALVLAALVIAAFIVVDQVTRVGVPDVSRQSPAAAAKKISGAGLAYKVNVDKSDGVCAVEPPVSDYCEATGQSIASKTRVRPDTKVSIVFKVKSVTIPDVVGLSYDDAVELASKVHLDVNPEARVVTRIDGYGGWKVLSQSRKAGDKMDAGMDFEVALDAPLIDLPQVTGMQFGAAIDALENVGLNGEYSSAPGSVSDENLFVRETEPASGSKQVPIGSDVTLKWGYKTPNVVGGSAELAINKLKSAGFNVDGLSVSQDIVVTQVPAAGTIADAANPVTLTLTPPTVVYEVVGDGSRASITWIAPGTFNISQASNARLPWRMTFENEDDYENFNAQSMNGSTITCNVYVNGELRNTNTSTGRYSVVSCG